MAHKKSLSHPSAHEPQARAQWRWRGSAEPPARDFLPGMARPRDRSGLRVDWVRTLVAKGPAPLQRGHLRHRAVPTQKPCLHVIALDVSGSMCQDQRLAWAKGYAVRLIEHATRAGDHVALLSFGGQGVELLLPPGPARAACGMRVRPVGGGGGTPLAACLAEADRLLRHARRRLGMGAASCLWLLTDGRTLEQPTAPTAAGHLVIVDFDDPRRSLGGCAAWARRWQAEYRRPDGV